MFAAICYIIGFEMVTTEALIVLTVPYSEPALQLYGCFYNVCSRINSWDVDGLIAGMSI